MGRIVVHARIVEMQQGSSTTKIIKFTTAVSLDFYPGQWVDLYIEIDGNIEIGGYSITSTPLEKNFIELAIKESSYNKVSRFLNYSAKIGQEVELIGGQGNCYYHDGLSDHIVLIAGGIGITPLMSILRFICKSSSSDAVVHLIYSASSEEEYVFRNELDRMELEFDQLECDYWVTKKMDSRKKYNFGRIDHDVIEKLVTDKSQDFFICGPTEMIDGSVEILLNLGVKQSSLHFEKWW